MSANWNEEVASLNYETYKDYKGFRSTWILDAIRYNNFRNGYHFTSAEIDELNKQRQAAIPINVTTAICETAEALLTAGDPIVSVVPARFHNEQNRENAVLVAAKYEAALKSSWYNSLGSLQYDRIIRDYNNVGRGLAYIVPKSVYGEFTVDMKYLSFLDFYPDPACRDPHYIDSDNMIVSYVLSKKAGYRLSKLFDEKMEEERFYKEFINSDFIDDSMDGMGDKYITRGYKKDNIIRFIQRLSLEEQTMYSISPAPRTNPEEKQLSIQLYDSIPYKSFMEIPDNIKKLVADKMIVLNTQKGFYLTEYTSLGGFGTKKSYPIDVYNIIPFVYDHNDHPFPLGRVHYIYPLQRALNKCLMIAILNASLSNNTKWLVEEKSIVDKDVWTNYQSVPGVLLEYKKLSPESQPPIQIPPTPLSEIFLQFPRYLQNIMEYVAGITQALMGVTDEKTPDVWRTVSNMQTAAGERIKRRLRNIDSSLTQVGRVVAKFYKEYAPLNGQLTWVEGFNKVKEAEYNSLIPDPTDPTKVVYKPGTDLGIGFRDLRFIMTSNQGYENANVAQTLMLLATQMKAPEAFPIILKKLNIPEAEELIKAMDISKQQNATIAQLQQQLEQVGKIAEGQAKQIEMQTKKMTVQDIESKFTRMSEKWKRNMAVQGFDQKQLNSMLEAFNTNELFKQEVLNGQSGNGNGSDPAAGSISGS